MSSILAAVRVRKNNRTRYANRGISTADRCGFRGCETSPGLFCVRAALRRLRVVWHIFSDAAVDRYKCTQVPVADRIIYAVHTAPRTQTIGVINPTRSSAVWGVTKRGASVNFVRRKHNSIRERDILLFGC